MRLLNPPEVVTPSVSGPYAELVLQLFDLLLHRLQLLVLLQPLGRRACGEGELRQAVERLLQLGHLPRQVVYLWGGDWG